MEADNSLQYPDESQEEEEEEATILLPSSGQSYNQGSAPPQTSSTNVVEKNSAPTAAAAVTTRMPKGYRRPTRPRPTSYGGQMTGTAAVVSAEVTDDRPSASVASSNPPGEVIYAWNLFCFVC